MRKCDRCGKTTADSIGSYFDMAMVCPACEKREKMHPQYQKAIEAENKALATGQWNFKGIGFPGWGKGRQTANA